MYLLFLFFLNYLRTFKNSSQIISLLYYFQIMLFSIPTRREGYIIVDNFYLWINNMNDIEVWC